eukprot:Ihof_evm4s322 gene=Ihof_evmTU4s322
MACIFLGAVCLGISGLCSMVYKDNNNTALCLQAIPETSVGGLKALLMKTPKQCCYVIVRGFVFCKEPIVTSLSRQQQLGCIYKLITKEHSKYWGARHLWWTTSVRDISTITRDTRFWLTESPCSSAFKYLITESNLPQVTDSLKAEVDLVTVYDEITSQGGTLLDYLYGFVMGSLTTGFQHIEQILPLDTEVWCFSEAAVTSEGLIVLRPVQDRLYSRLPYIIGRGSKHSVIEPFKTVAKNAQRAAIFFFLISGALFLYKAHGYVKLWYDERERERQEDEFREALRLTRQQQLNRDEGSISGPLEDSSSNNERDGDSNRECV